MLSLCPDCSIFWLVLVPLACFSSEFVIYQLFLESGDTMPFELLFIGLTDCVVLPSKFMLLN